MWPDALDMTETGGPRGPEGMAGLAKGLRIIEAYADRDAMSVALAARASGATRAAARRCLLTLAELGYVEHSGRDYRALPRLRALGGRAALRNRIAAVSQPFLDRARDELDESVSLAVLESGEALFVARAEAKHIVSTGVKVGGRLPAWCSATGRVFFADLPTREIVQRLDEGQRTRLTPKTVTEQADLLKAIVRVARDGYAISDEELELGLRALAVPVRCNGQTIAALSVSVSSSRIDIAALRERFLPPLKMVAARIGRELTDMI
jgi:IclR family pca regulon transcriptional regulator